MPLIQIYAALLAIKAAVGYNVFSYNHPYPQEITTALNNTRFDPYAP
jgi:hypothetical protein